MEGEDNVSGPFVFVYKTLNLLFTLEYWNFSEKHKSVNNTCNIYIHFSNNYTLLSYPCQLSPVHNIDTKLHASIIIKNLLKFFFKILLWKVKKIIMFILENDIVFNNHSYIYIYTVESLEFVVARSIFVVNVGSPPPRI